MAKLQVIKSGPRQVLTLTDGGATVYVGDVEYSLNPLISGGMVVSPLKTGQIDVERHSPAIVSVTINA